MSVTDKLTTCSKYDPGIEVDSDRVLCLHRNENLFVTKTWMREFVALEARDIDAAKYPEPSSLTLRRALAEHYRVTPDNVFVGNGADEVLSDLLGLLRHRYDTLATLDVHFKVYDLLADRFDFRHRTIPGGTFGTEKIDGKDWNGLALVDSPNAITGYRFTEAVLRQLAECPEAFIIWDNVYGEFASDTIPDELPDNMVIVRSFSKFYGLAGARVGYCIGSKTVIKQLLASKDSFNVNAFGQHLALKALSRCDEFEELKDRVVLCREILAEQLRERRFEVRDSGGNYVFATHREIAAQHLQQQLLDRDVAVRRFPGHPTDNFLRVTVPPRKDIDRLMQCLDEILAEQ